MAHVYEYMRTQGFDPLNFEEHYVRLDALSRNLFLAPVGISPEALKQDIAKALQQGGCSPRTANAVYVRCDANGAVSVEAVELLYNKFSLRALHPQGYLCRVSGELLIENSSAKESLVELNRSMAQISDEGVAIWVDEQGEVLAIDGAAVAAVFEDEIRFSRRGNGVEFDIAYSVAEGIKRTTIKGAIMADELRSAKELFCVDHRGITALHSFDSHRYMDIIADKIAARVADRERE